MYGLLLGISNVSEVLPEPVYALLSGLNAATVGVVALAAVQLSRKAITDKITRVVLFLGATAGMLCNALWFFPVLMLAAGLITDVWDLRWLHPMLKAISDMSRKLRQNSEGVLMSSNARQADEGKAGICVVSRI